MAPPTASAPDTASPGDLDDLIERFDRFSTGLVLLDPRPLAEIRAALEEISGAVAEHLGRGEGAVGAGSAADRRTGGVGPTLASDHLRFVTSLSQLWWFYRIVEGDDHGGHRQALGQYGRLLAEALRRHRADERSTGGAPAPPLRAPAARRSGKHN